MTPRNVLWIYLPVLALSVANCASGSLFRGGRGLWSWRAPFTKVASVEGIREYRFPNGLRAVLAQGTSAETVTVNVIYLVGSQHETDSQRGIAHLLEHLLFTGTARHPDFRAEVEALGATANARTTVDYTSFYWVLGTDPNDLLRALDLEADRMTNTILSPERIATELGVVRNEVERNENDPAQVLEDRVRAAAFVSHGAARRPADLVAVEQLRDFYHTWYRPDNTIVLVAGAFDESITLRSISKTLGEVPRPRKSLPATSTTEPTQDGERNIVLRMAGGTPRVLAAWHVPGASHPDHAALEVLAYALSESDAGVLYKSLVKPGIATQTTANAPLSRDQAAFFAEATVAAGGDVATAGDRLLDLVEGIGSNLPAGETIERVRTLACRLYEISGAPSIVAEELPGWIGAGDWRLFFVHRDRICNVSPEDLQRVARAYLIPSNRTAAVYIPTEAVARASIPPAPDLSDEFAKLGSGNAPVPYEPRAQDLRAIDAVTIRRTLWNGFELVVVPTETRDGAVHFRMSIDLGDEETLAGRTLAGHLCGRLLMRGSRQHTRREIMDRREELDTVLSVAGNATTAAIDVTVSSNNLAETVGLAAEILREPVFPADQFEEYRQTWLQRLEAARSDPETVATRALDGHLDAWPVGDPRHVTTAEELIEGVSRLTLHDVRRFHQDFYGASSGRAVVVGDVDFDEVAQLVETLFGGWTSRMPARPIPSPYRPVSPRRQVIYLTGRPSAALAAGMPLNLTVHDEDYPALAVGVYLLGGSTTSRLWRRIRDHEGRSYYVHADVDAYHLSPAAAFTVTASLPADGGSVRAVEAAIAEELARALKGGFTDAEVAAAKRTMLARRRKHRGDGELADRLRFLLEQGQTFAYDIAFEDRVRKVTAADVLVAMRRHLPPERLSVFVAGDVQTRESAAVGSSAAGLVASVTPHHKPDARGAGSPAPPNCVTCAVLPPSSNPLPPQSY